MINHLNEIGWLDPDKKQLETIDFTNLSIDGFAYEKSKYTPIHPPYLIYIPNQMVIRKMFQICVKHKNLNDIMTSITGISNIYD